MNLIDEMIAGLEAELAVVRREEEAAYEEVQQFETPARIARQKWSPIYKRRNQIEERIKILRELRGESHEQPRT